MKRFIVAIVVAGSLLFPSTAGAYCYYCLNFELYPSCFAFSGSGYASCTQSCGPDGCSCTQGVGCSNASAPSRVRPDGTLMVIPREVAEALNVDLAGTASPFIRTCDEAVMLRSYTRNQESRLLEAIVRLDL